MAHLGPRAFDSIGGEVVSTTTFVIKNSKNIAQRGLYFRLVDGLSETEKSNVLKGIISSPDKHKVDNFFEVSPQDFQKISGLPIAYWVSENIRSAFVAYPPLSEYAETRIGMITGDNERYIRFWFEVGIGKIGFNLSRNVAQKSNKKWFPQSKGGDFRKWFGNNNTILDWENDGQELQTRMHSSGHRILAHNFNLDKIFLAGITWTKISSGTFSVRLQPSGFLFNDASANAFPLKDEFTYPIVGFLCSKIPNLMLQAMNPTLNYLPGDISTLPVPHEVFDNQQLKNIVGSIIQYAKEDWNSSELSWDFVTLPLLQNNSDKLLSKRYGTVRSNWEELTNRLQQLEEENNRIFIKTYGLHDEVKPDVPLQEITLTCNPYYRYGNNRSDEELNALLLADTMKEFISYAVGCMFGRYSLDKPGLVLANQGETLKDYLKQVPKPTFLPDEDNAIPVLEGEWFNDDIAERFKKFLRVTFGEEHYEENLAFIEEAIGRDIRSYFVKEFYKDHVQTYKKRPIYWMFSSPKGSFNVLIYMHRYQPDTVSIVLNGYLREYIKKLNAHKSQLERTSVSGSASQSQKTKALKEIQQVNKVLSELKEYEDEVLYPLATQRVSIDLDDGVKVNYGKFGSALAKVKGL